MPDAKMFQVELEAMIAYKNGRACFRIHQESEGIFTAYLITFLGENSESPPEEITMVRSIRNWIGSTEDEILLRELGAFIDNQWAKTS
jgi:hypothetical protein